MTDPTLVGLAVFSLLVGLSAYAVFAGADFGGGVWDLFASGPRRNQQRSAIARAIGPVWEVNHVWIIFVVVDKFLTGREHIKLQGSLHGLKGADLKQRGNELLE